MVIPFVAAAALLALPALRASTSARAQGVENPRAAGLLDEVRSTWMAMKGFRARLEQTQHFVGFDQPIVSAGRLSVLRPSYFSIAFEPPYNQKQVCDGKYVWTYMPEQNQVFRVELGLDATRGADLLNWVLDGATAISLSPDDTFAKGTLRLELLPGPNLPLQELRIWVREEGARLLGAEVVDAEGNRTTLRVRDVKPDRDLQPKDFAFSPPAGVHVVEAR